MKIKQKVISKLDAKFGDKPWYNLIKINYIFRTLVMSAWGTIITFGFAIYNGILGIVKSSIWHGAFSAYMIILALQRLLVILVYGIVNKKFGSNDERLGKEKLKIYLTNGATFIPITIALAVIIALLMKSQKPLVSDGILAITTAAYAFYKITMAIINVAKAKTMHDPIIQTIRNDCLVDAIVSIILLESTLITTFGELTYDMLVLTAITGLVGCGFTLALGTYMVVSGSQKLHPPKTNN